MAGKTARNSDWRVEYGPDREYNLDRTYAIFYDNNSDRRLKVSIRTRLLREFAIPPLEVLRAMLRLFEDSPDAIEVKRGQPDEVEADGNVERLKRLLKSSA